MRVRTRRLKSLLEVMLDPLVRPHGEAPPSGTATWRPRATADGSGSLPPFASLGPRLGPGLKRLGADHRPATRCNMGAPQASGRAPAFGPAGARYCRTTELPRYEPRTSP